MTIKLIALNCLALAGVGVPLLAQPTAETVTAWVTAGGLLMSVIVALTGLVWRLATDRQRAVSRIGRVARRVHDLEQKLDALLDEVRGMREQCAARTACPPDEE